MNQFLGLFLTAIIGSQSSVQVQLVSLGATEFEVKVFDADGKPLDDADVELFDSKGTKVTKRPEHTNLDGIVKFKVDPPVKEGTRSACQRAR